MPTYEGREMFTGSRAAGQSQEYGPTGGVEGKHPFSQFLVRNRSGVRQSPGTCLQGTSRGQEGRELRPRRRAAGRENRRERQLVEGSGGLRCSERMRPVLGGQDRAAQGQESLRPPALRINGV